MKKLPLNIIIGLVLLIGFAAFLIKCTSIEPEPPKPFEYSDIMSEELIELLEYSNLDFDDEDFVKENAISSFRDEQYGKTYYVIGEATFLDIPCQVAWSAGAMELFGDFKVDECELYEQKLQDALHETIETWGDDTMVAYLPIPDEDVAKIRLKFTVVNDKKHAPTNEYRVWMYYDADGDNPVDVPLDAIKADLAEKQAERDKANANSKCDVCGKKPYTILEGDELCKSCYEKALAYYLNDDEK